MELGLIEKHLRPGYFKKQQNLSKTYVGLSPQVYFALVPHLDVQFNNPRMITLLIGRL
jgi:hypothetical protein